ERIVEHARAPARLALQVPRVERELGHVARQIDDHAAPRNDEAIAPRAPRRIHPPAGALVVRARAFGAREDGVVAPGLVLAPDVLCAAKATRGVLVLRLGRQIRAARRAVLPRLVPAHADD